MSLPVRTKQPDEIRTLAFDFGPKIALGARLTGAPTVSAAVGITVLASTVDGTLVLAQVSGGTLGTTYQVTAKVNVTNGDLLEMDVLLRIAEEN
jgi:hypothetical protein